MSATFFGWFYLTKFGLCKSSHELKFPFYFCWIILLTLHTISNDTLPNPTREECEMILIIRGITWYHSKQRIIRLTTWPNLSLSLSALSLEYRIYWLYPLLWNKTPFPIKRLGCPEFDIKLYMMARLQLWRSGVPLHCHYSQVHSDPKW